MTPWWTRDTSVADEITVVIAVTTGEARKTDFGPKSDGRFGEYEQISVGTCSAERYRSVWAHRDFSELALAPELPCRPPC
jgi:hypothetical protein